MFVVSNNTFISVVGDSRGGGGTKKKYFCELLT